MGMVFKVISLLLSYPTFEFFGVLSEVKTFLEEDKSITAKEKNLLQELVNNLLVQDLYDAQERYVFLFDRTRTLSLHLFEHIHGESRDRGQAMVDLMSTYENDGFVNNSNELPDYLPLFLEYLSIKSQAEAIELLGQTVHILTVLFERLKKRESVYANAFAVLVSVAKKSPNKEVLAELLSAPDADPNDLPTLDKIWEEEAVTFGGNSDDNACGTDRVRTQIRAHMRKPADNQDLPQI